MKKRAMALAMALCLLLWVGCKEKEEGGLWADAPTGADALAGTDALTGTDVIGGAPDLEKSGMGGEASKTVAAFEAEGISKELCSLAAIDEQDRTVALADAKGATVVSFDGASVSVAGSGCTVDGTTVTITKAGTYVLEGVLRNGCVIVDADKKSVVRLVLNGVTITNDSSAAIFVKKSLKTILSLENGTVSTLTDGKQYVYADESVDEPKAALYSKSELTINGSGTLVVNGNYNDGITCKDSLKLLGGVYQITSADDGIVGKDMVVIENGSYTIHAQGDGIKSSNDTDETLGFILVSDGEFDIAAENDAIQAETKLAILDGSFRIVAGGGSSNAKAHADDYFGFGGWMNRGNTAASTATESRKGLKAGVALQIEGGTFVMDTCDDALHSNGTVRIDSGEYTITSGDDGIHADTALLINNGTVSVVKSYEGLEALSITINGGEISVVASDDGINAAGDIDMGTAGSPAETPDGKVPSNGTPDGRTPGNSAPDGKIPGNGTQDGTAWNKGAGGWQGDMFGRGGMMYGGNANASLVINGGAVYVSAQGDGLDANGSITINGGTVFVDGPTASGNAALDYDVSASINGGTVAFAGSLGMAMAPSSDSEQASIALSFAKMQAAGTTVVLYDSTGTEIFRYTPAKDFQHLVLSSSQINRGGVYSIVYGEGSSTGAFTLSDGAVTYVGSDGSTSTQGNGGGMGGFGRDGRKH